MKGQLQTVTLEGYGSYAGMKQDGMLVGVNGKHIILRASNPLNPKETTDSQFRVMDGCKVRSVPDRGFAIPKSVVKSIVEGEVKTSSPSLIQKKGKGIKLATKSVVKGKVPLKSKTSASNGNSKTVAKAPEPTPVKRGPGRPRKDAETSVKAPVQAAEAPRRRGRPPKAEATPLPKGQARVQLSKGIADYVVSQIKPKSTDENLRSLREAIRTGVHTNYVEVVLSKELAQTLIDFLASHYEKFGTMGVTGGAFKRGIPSLMGRLQESFKALKVPKVLGGTSSVATSSTPTPTNKVKSKAPEPVTEIPVKRGPGRPPKNPAPVAVGTVPVKRGPGRPKGSVNKAPTAPVNKVPLKKVGGKVPLKRK